MSAPLRHFPPFALDSDSECLWREGERIRLTPKAYAVLHCLVERAGRLVRKQELLDAVWPEGFVGDGVLKVCISEARRALGESAAAPRFIQTLHGRGYRFAAAVSEQPPREDSRSAADGELFGRESASERLETALTQALTGARQLVFVAGEEGIGKTALVEALLRRAARRPGIETVRGACHSGQVEREPYYPLLEALGRLGRGPRSEIVGELLLRHAPTWLAELPALVSPERRALLQREFFGATRDRMLREFCEALEALTRQFPLVIALEDLHESDPSTLDLISAVARRTDPARLLLLCTYNPVEGGALEKRLIEMSRELLVHGCAQEVALTPLSQADVAAYLAARFPDRRVGADLAAAVNEESGGNPLLMNAYVEHLDAQDQLAEGARDRKRSPAAEGGQPGVLEELVGLQLDRLPANERQLLEAASVAGQRFPVALVAAALGISPEMAETRCAALAGSRQLLKQIGFESLPDGSFTSTLEFRQRLTRDLLYQRLPPGRRAELHRRIATRLETVPTANRAAIAPDLAHHLEAIHDYERAARHLLQVADSAGRRFATREATDTSRHALELLTHLPEAERAAQEIEIFAHLGAIYRAAGESQQAVEAYQEALSRAEGAGMRARQVAILMDMSLALCWFDQERGAKVVERAVALAEPETDMALHGFTLGMGTFWKVASDGPLAVPQGDPRDEFRAALQALRAAGDQERLPLLLLVYSAVLGLSSDYRAALRVADDALAFAHETAAPLEVIVGEWFRAWELIYLGEWGEARRGLSEAIARAKRDGLAPWASVLEMELAWLHFQALDFSGARSLCVDSLTCAREHTLLLTQQRGLAQLGLAELGLGRHAAAREAFQHLRSWQSGRRLLMDWFWCMPVDWGMAEIALAEGDRQRAQEEAERFCDSASVAGERTWRALAFATRARADMARGEPAAAEWSLSQARSCLDEGEAPLAAWRVHAARADFFRLIGRPDEASVHEQRSRAVLSSLAASLGDDPLRAVMEAALPAARW